MCGKCRRQDLLGPIYFFMKALSCKSSLLLLPALWLKFWVCNMKRDRCFMSLCGTTDCFSSRGELKSTYSLYLRIGTGQEITERNVFPHYHFFIMKIIYTSILQEWPHLHNDYGWVNKWTTFLRCRSVFKHLLILLQKLTINKALYGKG